MDLLRLLEFTEPASWVGDKACSECTFMWNLRDFLRREEVAMPGHWHNAGCMYKNLTLLGFT
jgi:hypothetical protein